VYAAISRDILGDESLNLLDIIIVNYNSTDYLLRCLQSVYDSLQQFSAKIFVQDNASEDEVDRVSSMFPQVLLSKHSYNMGFAKAINEALRKGVGTYVVLLNPDTHLSDNFFEPVISYMEANTDLGVIGPKILERDGSTQGSARSFPTPLTALFGRTSLLSRLFPNNSLTGANILTVKCDGKTPMEVDWVSGACMLVRRRAIERVGPLDERFFLYWEDADWCKRMWEAGWKVVYFPQATVVHHVGGSSERSPLRSTVEFHKSAYRLFAKHAKGPQRLAIPLSMGALSLRLFLSLTWNAMHHWSRSSCRQSRPKNSLRN
jgi:GT2 family glycosyltransferase